MRYPPSAMAGGGGALQAAGVPRLADAILTDTASLITWTEDAPGRLRAEWTSHAAATTQSTPALGSTLVWPVLRDGVQVTEHTDVMGGLMAALYQVAGVPGAATNYAVVAGVCRADLSEYAFVGVDHAVSPSRGVIRVSGSAYTVNAAASAGRICKASLYQNVSGFEVINTALGEDVTTDFLYSPGGSTLGYGAVAQNRSTGVGASGLRYFLSIIPRGALGSKPADVVVDVRTYRGGAR